MRKNIELRIYELLGIKIFKKIVLKIVLKMLCILIIPLTPKMTKEERYRDFRYSPSNYFVGRIINTKTISALKRKLRVNAIIHMVILISCIRILLKDINNSLPISTICIDIFFSLLNMYCIILQRYNIVRINILLKKRQNMLCKI